MAIVIMAPEIELHADWMEWGLREAGFEVIRWAGLGWRPEHSATIYSGSLSHGQSHATAFAMLVTEQTGIPMEKIDLVQGDTDLIPKGGGTNASTAWDRVAA